MNIETLLIASGQNVKRLLDFGARRSWLSQRPYVHRPLSMRSVTVGSIVQVVPGGQRGYFSTPGCLLTEIISQGSGSLLLSLAKRQAQATHRQVVNNAVSATPAPALKSSQSTRADLFFDSR